MKDEQDHHAKEQDHTKDEKSERREEKESIHEIIMHQEAISLNSHNANKKSLVFNG